MIFYFTGTGNSLAAAKALAKEGEQLVDIAAARRTKSFTYQVKKGEPVGFVYPEYCGSVGEPMLDFISHLELSGQRYVYAVVTCGGSSSTSAGLLRRALRRRGIRLHRAFRVRMPDNCIVFLPTPSEEKAKKLLAEADRKLAEIRSEIPKCKIRFAGPGLIASLMQPVYRAARTTKPYHADNTCISCGRCAKVCPEQAIEMRGGKPQWVRDKCAMCTACINRCPVQAIQYGRVTRSRTRYVHPDLR